MTNCATEGRENDLFRNKFVPSKPVECIFEMAFFSSEEFRVECGLSDGGRVSAWANNIAEAIERPFKISCTVTSRRGSEAKRHVRNK